MGANESRRSFAGLDSLDLGTVGSAITPPPEISQTETTEALGWRRNAARVDLAIAAEEHRGGVFSQWTQRSNWRARLGTVEILDDIADLGFAWRDIARLAGVTVQAVQKWRRGGSVTPDNKSRLSTFLGACDLIADVYGVQEIASWFEIAMVPAVPVTPIDLWLAQRPDLVFDYASGHTDAEETLTSWNPQWREQYRSDFEVFRAGDGHLSIRPKDR